jgi:uncharacterized glyoxalase superfamily protein PhnB
LADDDGKVMNAEMRAGDGEFWLDGGKPATASQRPTWIGIWVDDVDAVFRQVPAAGVGVDPPVDREIGVRMLNVRDPMGYEWGFMTHQPVLTTRSEGIATPA